MNLKTTLVLLVLAVAGGVLFQFGPAAAPYLGLGNPSAPVGNAGTLPILETELAANKLRRIEVRHDDRTVVFERDADGGWSLPGKWPTRKQEVEELVTLLTALRSRFAPIPLEASSNLTEFGLQPPAVTVEVRADNKDYRLSFGEEPGDGNRFSRATYLRLAERTGATWKDKPEAVRLAPGLIAVLDRPLEFYQQRRLFPSERLAKEGEPTEKIEQLAAKTVAWTKAKDTFTLSRDGDDWKLQAKSEGEKPLEASDRPDPDKLKAILAAVPDIWAEQFVIDPKKTLADYGLDKPEETLTVTRPGGDQVTLLLGKESPRFLERTVTEPAPPGSPFPTKSRVEREPLRYAKLKDNGQVFEIKADRLKDVFVALDTLRDARLARFRPEDAIRLELSQDGKTIVLAKEKDQWKLKKPMKASAETARVTEVLDQLAKLEARGADIDDHPNLKADKLDPPVGTATVTIEEEIKGDKKKKKTRVVQFLLGKHDTERKRLLLRVDGWPRVNTVKDDLVKLFDRPALAYRGRAIFDLQPADIKQVEVERDGGKEEYTLEQSPDEWQLTVPVTAAADTKKVADMVRDLCHLHAIEYVNDTPSDKELDEVHGLAKPALVVRLKPSDKLKSPQTLRIGKKNGNKPAYFAQLASRSSSAVFTIPKELHDALDRPSLAYRPLQLWKVAALDAAALRIQHGQEAEYRLVRDGKGWKIAGPFDAPIDAGQVATLLAALTAPRCERYENHGTKELDKFGLAKPFLRAVLVESGKDKKEHVLLIGNPTGKDETSRFAKLGDSDAIVVVNGPFISRLDAKALDFLDRNLLSIASKTITRIRSSGGEPGWTIARDKDVWEVQAGDTKFVADGTALAAFLFTCGNLEAQRYAAYGPHVEWAKYGLDKPASTITLTVAAAGKDAKAVEHTVAVGQPVEGENTARYARVDAGPGVVVLGPKTAVELGRTYLDFVPRTLFDLDANAISGITRKMKDRDLELVKGDDGWRILKPAETKGDTKALDALAARLAKLRAQGVAAYPAKDLKTYGLDEPTAILTLRLGDGADKQHVLKIGNEIEGKPERYAQVEGSQVVAVLPGELARQLLAPPIYFRDRAVAHFANADKLQLERGPRKATFAQVDGTWKLIEPTEAEAEQNELDEFVNDLARLRADELVAEKPDDLKPYGLDRPEAAWRLLSGDKEVMNLLIGAREKIEDREGPRCYAKLASGDVVFLLGPAMTRRVLAEYRTRSLWPVLDAVQVERIDYRYPDGKDFTLEKVNNTWQVAGQPDRKVNTSAVNETLAALASLKAERTVVDKDADLKLFGLEPPQLVLEVRAKTGAKRVLEIGRSEGESKRSYARAVGGNRGDVVIISEADGARIVRNLAAFSDPSEKRR